MNYLSGFTVILTCFFTLYCFYEFMFSMHLCDSDNINNNSINEVLYYKNIMSIVYLFCFICFLSLTIFGYLKNCIFTPWKARILGVQTYITLLIILSLPEFFKYKKGKCKIKKTKFNIRKKLILIFSILTFSFLSTLISAYIIL